MCLKNKKIIIIFEKSCEKFWWFKIKDVSLYREIKITAL